MARNFPAEVERFHLRRDADQISRVTLFGTDEERDRTLMVVGSAAIMLPYRSLKSSHSSWIRFCRQIISVPDLLLPTQVLCELRPLPLVSRSRMESWAGADVKITAPNAELR